MASATESSILPLEAGDRLNRDEFEIRYRAMPPTVRAELIEGVVYVADLVTNGHGTARFNLAAWLGSYQAFTQGTEGAVRASIRLDRNNEPQPDILLRIRPDHGGRPATSDDDTIEGAPELVVEVASSSVSYDLHDKLRAYRRNGVLEYIVHRVKDGAIDWFILRGGRYERLAPAADGLFRSEVFPGLWLDAAAFLRGDHATVLRTAQEGVNSPEHAAFVGRLAGAHARIAARAPTTRPGGPRP